MLVGNERRYKLYVGRRVVLWRVGGRRAVLLTTVLTPDACLALTQHVEQHLGELRVFVQVHQMRQTTVDLQRYTRALSTAKPTFLHSINVFQTSVYKDGLDGTFFLQCTKSFIMQIRYNISPLAAWLPPFSVPPSVAIAPAMTCDVKKANNTQFNMNIVT